MVTYRSAGSKTERYQQANGHSRPVPLRQAQGAASNGHSANGTSRGGRVPVVRTAVCDQCGAAFRSNQGLSGHQRFRHSDASWSASVDRAREQRAEALASFSAMPALPRTTALLIAKLQRRYAVQRREPSPTDCVICGAVCKTSQGLSGHMRYRHGAGGQRPDRRSAAELIRYAQTHSLPEPVAEAVWEKVLRMEGFRW